MRNYVLFAASMLLLSGTAYGASLKPAAKSAQLNSKLEEVAQSPNYQWTGVARSKDGRLFVNYPRWQKPIAVSVAELRRGSPVAYPNANWNLWQEKLSPEQSFVCVQSVFVDANDRMWVLDAASPNMKGIVKGGPKLVQIDPATNNVVRVFHFDETVAPDKSYLNDVRIDLKRNVAIITESNLGAIIVLNLETGVARRLLTDSPSVKPEDITVVIRGKKWLRDGKQPKIAADGLAIDANSEYVYYKALTGKTLYRIAISALVDESLSAQQLASKVESVGTTVVSDGIEFGADGKLYMTSITDSSIKRFDVTTKALETVVADKRLDWPDSFALADDHTMLVSTSQIDAGSNPKQPYGLFRFKY